MGITRKGVQSASDVLDLALHVFYLRALAYLFAFRLFNRAVDFSHVPAVLEETVKVDLCNFFCLLVFRETLRPMACF